MHVPLQRLRTRLQRGAIRPQWRPPFAAATTTEPLRERPESPSAPYDIWCATAPATRDKPLGGSCRPMRSGAIVPGAGFEPARSEELRGLSLRPAVTAGVAEAERVSFSRCSRGVDGGVRDVWCRPCRWVPGSSRLFPRLLPATISLSVTSGTVHSEWRIGVAENPSRQEGPEVECRVNEIRLRQSPVTCWESAHRAPLPGVALPVRNGGGSTTSTCLPWQTRIDSSRYLPSVRSGIDVQPPAV